ncbi:1,2-phenylacetyl-CoA epoxidase subunit PaaC [Sulfobacillus sp. hq2]|uniref:1,2-phenylacetyl-CoA epoxidase subunit PaaC n=1 Tax=Sulfobacillus sp. hq2 TaxID=2039167 RepID=UPI000CD09609|nr:1,2-phenylacetyl-CoA epoxidase subunit PaaC [Sulfobacillus sp. hq2]POB12244.1 phenylacetate-CoA oxygenase subunit PaaI [Sulfobacillus sp. hq2]
MIVEILTDAERAALQRILIPVADDEWILGHRGSEWLGLAPDLEEDLALSSITQDSLGHAQLLYDIVADLGGYSADQWVYARSPSEWKHCQLVEMSRQDWADLVAGRFVYETFDEMRLEMLNLIAYQPLQAAVTKIRQEKMYHLQHFESWVDTLVLGGQSARQRILEALTRVYALIGDMFVWEETKPGLDLWHLDETARGLPQKWVTRLQGKYESLGLPWHTRVIPQAESNGRLGQHAESFFPLWKEMTSVREIAPLSGW